MRINPNSWLFLFVIVTLSNIAVAQNPLKGTWIMVSAKGTGADGEPFRLDSATTHEIKIITEKHYILIASNKVGKSLSFNRSYAGTLSLDGDKYMETPQYSSSTIFDGVKTNYTWKLKGEDFIQSGTLVRPDGKKIVLEEMIFHRVKENTTGKNPAMGAWILVSSASNIGGQTETHTSETERRFQVITPGYWMRISLMNNRFESAMGGTYKMSDGKMLAKVKMGSIPLDAFGKITVTDSVNGKKLLSKVEHLAPDGSIQTWEEVFERTE
jgi:hypothetical protein